MSHQDRSRLRSSASTDPWCLEGAQTYGPRQAPVASRQASADLTRDPQKSSSGWIGIWKKDKCKLLRAQSPYVGDVCDCAVSEVYAFFNRFQSYYSISFYIKLREERAYVFTYVIFLSEYEIRSLRGETTKQHLNGVCRNRTGYNERVPLCAFNKGIRAQLYYDIRTVWNKFTVPLVHHLQMEV